MNCVDVECRRLSQRKASAARYRRGTGTWQRWRWRGIGGRDAAGANRPDGFAERVRNATFQRDRTEGASATTGAARHPGRNIFVAGFSCGDALDPSDATSPSRTGRGRARRGASPTFSTAGAGPRADADGPTRATTVSGAGCVTTGRAADTPGCSADHAADITACARSDVGPDTAHHPDRPAACAIAPATHGAEPAGRAATAAGSIIGPAARGRNAHATRAGSRSLDIH